MCGGMNGWIHNNPECTMCIAIPVTAVLCEPAKRNSLQTVSVNRIMVRQIMCEFYADLEAEFPIWSSGKDSWFSPRRPGFNSRYGKPFMWSTKLVMEDPFSSSLEYLTNPCGQKYIRPEVLVSCHTVGDDQSWAKNLASYHKALSVCVESLGRD